MGNEYRSVEQAGKNGNAYGEVDVWSIIERKEDE